MTTAPRALLLLLLAGLSMPARASDESADAHFELPADATITNEILVATDIARIEGSALDDVFVFAGRTLDVSGHVAGDAWLCGSAITLSGRIDDHVRAAGQTVTIRGELRRGLAAAAATVLLDTNSVVRGPVAVAGENIVLQGQIDGTVQAIGQSATVGGQVAGDVHVTAADIVVIPGATIGGDLYYTSSKELFLDRTVQLGGKLVRQPLASPQPVTRDQILGLVAMRALQVLAALLVGLPFMLLFPRTAEQAGRALRHAPGRTLISGLASCFLLPLVALLALVSVIGIPLALIVAAAFLTLLYVGKIVVAATLGARLLGHRAPHHRFSAALSTLALGLLLIYGLAELPVVGGSIALLVGILGLGALLLSMLRSGTGGHGSSDVPSAPEAAGPQAES